MQKETDEILSEARKKALKKESVMLEEAREEAAQIVAVQIEKLNWRRARSRMK